VTTATIATASRWTMASTADLAGLAGAKLPEPDAELIADLTANGMIDPLYIMDTSAGRVLIDGYRRLAAAAALGWETVPTTDKPMIRLSLLAAHPGNVRQDLKLTKQYLAQTEGEGIRVALMLTRDPDVEGGIRLIDGHRRVAAGLKGGLTHAPYQWEGDRDEASQYVDMVTTAKHRESLTLREEAAALFSAAEAGAKVARLAKASGRTVKEAKTVIRAGGSETVAQIAKGVPSLVLTLEHMNALAELDGDSEAVARVEAATKSDPRNLSWIVQRELKARASRLAAQQHLSELEAAGARIRERDELSDKALPVRQISGQSAETHQAACKGHAWVLEEGAAAYEAWCVNASLYGHMQPASGTTDDAEAAKVRTEERRAVIRGNLDWDASETVRRAWLKELVCRRSWPKGAEARTAKATPAHLQRVTSRHLRGGSSVLSDGLTSGKARGVLADLIGKKDAARLSRADMAVTTGTATANRLIAEDFAVLAAAYEVRMTRAAWRIDKHEYVETRRDAAAWLTILAALGYQLTPIEQAVCDGQPYTGSPAPSQADADADALD
jgi:ParB family chromosome partitioning protein